MKIQPTPTVPELRAQIEAAKVVEINSFERTIRMAFDVLLRRGFPARVDAARKAHAARKARALLPPGTE